MYNSIVVAPVAIGLGLEILVGQIHPTGHQLITVFFQNLQLMKLSRSIQSRRMIPV